MTRGKFVKVRTARGRKNSSTKWLQRQLNDPYVEKARTEGFKSRAAFKIIEINEKFKILKKGAKVLDLGAAPGGWSQVAADIVGSNSDKPSVLAVDLLEMDQLPGVICMQKDFLDEDAKDVIIQTIGDKLDVVLSDMAANTTGHSKTDHIRIMELCKKVALFSFEILKPGGAFVAKIFKGGTEDQLLAQIKQKFSKVKHFKPDSSRKESSEEYLVATGFKD